MNSSVLRRVTDVQPVDSKSDLRPSLIWLLPALLILALLWFRLIDHLRVEWTVNPQYAYGWAVPFLCAYLVWRACPDWIPITLTLSPRESRHRFIGILACLAALLYAPTRLIQEANPEWRLVSWALALEVLAITFYLISCFSIHVSRFTFHAPRFWLHSPRSTLHSSRPFSALLFFLVAVPWPTPIEAPLVRGLTAVNSATTVELLSWCGVPAVQHGNLIEVGGGLVGIDEACSGIRSFQATLMLSLFFAELYRVAAWKRLGLCLAGFGLSFVFNVARTTLLTTVAAHRGAEAIAHWHDPAGIAILLACFFCLWLIAKSAKPARAFNEHSTVATKLVGEPGAALQSSGLPMNHKRTTHPSPLPSPHRMGKGGRTPRGSASRLQCPCGSRWELPMVLLLCSLLAAETGTELWYRWHESHLPVPVTWTIALPRNNPSLRPLPLSPQTRQLLRCDEAINAGWEDPDGRRWQAIFLRWAPGRTAVHLAEGHAPEVCLTAAGNELISRSDMRTLSCGELSIPFRIYTFKNGPARLHVLYCLWRDRAPGQNIATTELNWRNRLAPVLNGMRHTGERSLELALWGYLDDDEAEAALEQELRDLIQPPPASNGAVAALSP